MSLTIENLSSIPNISLARNPMVFEVSSDDIWDTVGVPSVQTFQFDEDPSDGDTLEFQSGVISQQVKFRFKTTPAASTDIAIGDYTTEAWTRTVVDKLNKNYFLKTYYIIEYDGTSGHKIKFTARASGTSYTLTFVDDSFLITTVNITGAANGVRKKNFRIVAQIYTSSDGGTTFDYLVDIVNVPDDEGVTSFDLSPFIQSVFSVPSLPAYNDNQMSILTDRAKIYHVNFFEYGDDPPVYYIGIVTDDLVTLDGGMAALSFPDYKDLETDFIQDGRWLSLMPSKREVTADQQLYGTFYNYASATSVSLKCTIYYSDGTSKEYSPIYFQTVQQADVLQFPQGFNQLGLENVDSSKTPVKYTVSVINAASGAIISRVLTFVLVDNHVNERFFLFYGSMSNWESLRTTGDQEDSLKVDKEELIRIRPDDYSSTDIERDGELMELTEPKEVATGAIEKDELEGALEILSSEHVYLVENGKFIRIHISGGTFTKYVDDQGVYSFSFNYMQSLRTDYPTIL